MSLLELIAERSTIDPAAFSLPDLLAERALAQLPDRASGQVNQQIIGFFAAELLREDPAHARRYAETLLDHGVRENVFLEGYAAGAAALLGTAWEDDRLSFAMVTHGLGQLMDVVRDCISAPPAQPFMEIDRPRVLMARAPGEEHVLGLLIVAQDMRRRGWLVRVHLSGDLEALAAATQMQPFDLIGFTASCRDRCRGLRTAIRQIRGFQPNSAITVGGGIGDDEGLAEDIGADLVVGRQAGSVERLIEHFRIVPG